MQVHSILSSLYKNKKYLALVFLWIIIGLILTIHSRRNEIFDDAFITYRYTANLVNRGTFVYNYGEAVLGTTTPGYGLLLAIPAFILGWEQLPNISIVFNMLLLFITAINIALLVYRLSRDALLSTFAASFVAVAPFTIRAAVGGMEMALYLALLSGIFCAEIYKHSSISALLAGLLVWVRPEGVFAIALLSAWYLLQWLRKDLTLRKLIQQGGLLMIPGILYLLFLLIGYNTILPQSILAKSAGLYETSLKHNIEVIQQHTIRFETVIHKIPTLFEFLIAMLHYAVALSGAIFLVRRKNILTLIPILYLIHVAFYISSRTNISEWYYGNFELLEIASLLIGIYSIAQVVRNLSRKQSLDIYLRWFSYILILSFLFINIQLPLNHWINFLQSSPQFPRSDGRMELYYQLVERIKDYIPTDARIMMPEIGVLGFFMPDVYVMDAAGLVSPEATQYFPISLSERRHAGVGAIPIGYVHDYRPDMIITLDVFGEKGILDDEKFWADYTAVIVWKGDLPFRSKALYVFSRNNFIPGMDLQYIEAVHVVPWEQ